jgi:HD-GYP domain-containing protein (c-di-GMP phosphodiesterase class II)
VTAPQTPGSTGHGSTGHGANPGSTGHGSTGHGSAGHGSAGHGSAGHGSGHGSTGHGEDEEALALVRAGAAEAALLQALGAALRVSRLHALDNVAAKQAVDELHAGLGRFLADHDRAVILVGDAKRVYVNGRLTRARRQGGEWLDEAADTLTRTGAAGLALGGAWTLEATRALVLAFRPPPGSSAHTAPAERLTALRIALGRVEAPALVEALDAATAQAIAREEEEAYGTEGQRAAFYLARLVALCGAARAAVARGAAPDTMARLVRQTLMKIVDGLERPTFEARALAVTAIEPEASADAEVREAAHAARVAFLSLVLGRQLGLPRGPLADLGLAALHHDLGPARQSEDRAALEPHVVGGVGVALRARNYATAGLLRLVVAHEHHRPGTGFPDAVYLKPPHALARLVAVADAWDRLEHGRPGGPGPLSPVGALQALLASGHDPQAVELLTATLGFHPRGSVLRLASGEVVVVVANGERTGQRPIVRRVLLATGEPDEAQPVGALGDPGVIVADLGRDVGFDWRSVLLG